MYKYVFRWNFVCCLGISLFLMSTISNAQPSAFCKKEEVIRSYIAQDYERALSLNEHCIEYYKTKTANLNPNGELNGWQWIDVVSVGYHICTGSQIAAEMGLLLTAKDMIDEAKQYARSWPYTNQLVRWSEIINVTEGYYLEMADKTYEAEQFYKDHQDQHTLSRLAVLALKRRDINAAIEWAAQSAEKEALNLTALIIMASIGRSGEPDDAAKVVLKPILKQKNYSNQFMPVYYAEVWWAELWIEGTGNIEILPQID